MTSVNRATLYTYFLTGNKPTQAQFANLVDSCLNLATTSAQAITADVSALGKLDVGGDLTVKASANTSLTGNLTVTGTTTLGAFSPSSVTTSALSVITSGLSNLTGNVNVGGRITIAASATISGDLNVLTSARTTLTGPLIVSGSALASFSGNVGITGNLSVTSSAAANNLRATRTTAGALTVGSTTDDGNLIYATTDGSVLAALSLNNSDATASSQVVAYFRRGLGNPGSVVGTITTTNVATAFNTSSDKRLKSPLRPLDTGAILDQLEVGVFDWKFRDKTGVGVLAQDVLDIVPEAVQPGDDGLPDADGNVQKQWQVDYSKFVPYLLAEVKSLRNRVKQMEGK